MKRITVVASLLTLGLSGSIASAASGSASGPAALALAGVVASHSSVLSNFKRRIVRRLFNGNHTFWFGISVTANSIVCRVSTMDIISRGCELTFRAGKAHGLTGREANELFATLATAGVGSEGAAGTIIESVTNLACT